MSAKDKKTDQHVKELEQQIEQLRKENQELLEKLQRLSADYANYQKRVPRQIADTVMYEKKKIIRSLLPSLDNFEHALAGAAAAEGGPEALENIIKGVKLIFDHMLDALKALGVEKVNSVGQPFDPSRHEALMQRCEPDKEDGIVLEEYQACYLLGEDVLRPAKVIINKVAPEKQTPQQPAETGPESDTKPSEETNECESEKQ
ncbi:MAG: nucleotide exchange factor GrpE [Planctomycetes bacterium]|jgi:molecular chaperone GrpE|nr:nucleotide exchange factor GrpE [Planctomycetota bacterium]